MELKFILKKVKKKRMENANKIYSPFCFIDEEEGEERIIRKLTENRLMFHEGENVLLFLALCPFTHLFIYITPRVSLIH